MKRNTVINERGFTLIELIVTAAIILTSIVALYIGIVYAEAQLTSNHIYRCFYMEASGKMDRIITLFTKTGEISSAIVGEEDVEIEIGEGHKIRGLMQVPSPLPASEMIQLTSMEFVPFVVKITWQDPGTGKARYISIREDAYRE